MAKAQQPTTDLPIGEPSVNGEQPESEPIDPWDPAAFRFTEAEFKQQDVHSVKHVTSIPVRQPGGKEWFRLHPTLKLTAAIVLRPAPESLRGETYLVKPPWAHHFGHQLSPVVLHFGINSLDAVFLWPRKIAGPDGRMSDIMEAQEEIALTAEHSWVRMEWDNGARVHHYHEALDDLGDPQFPPYDLGTLLKLGFKGKVVESDDHDVVREFQRGKA